MPGDEHGDAGGDGSGGGRSLLGRVPRRRPTWDEVALGVFLLYVAVAGPLILLRLGDFQWFMRDEWLFLADQEVPGDVLEPVNAHWVSLPRLVYAAGFELVGVNRYWPYQGLNVALHLGIAVLGWVVMRRAQVNAWIATAAASLLVLFGPGSQNIVWAFQITLNGAVLLGLVHLLLSDHDGPWDRRDSLGLACGVLALTCSGVAVVMVAVVVMSVLVRRGPLLALAHGAPPAAIYLAWTVTQDPTTSSPFGRPAPDEVARWVGIGLEGTLRAVSAHRPLEVVFGVVLVVGLVLAWAPWDREALSAARARLAAPTALLAGTVVMMTITAWGRWRPGPADLILSSRYLHVTAALGLPALAVAADALARRWRPLLPVLVVLLVLPIPANLDGFEPPIFGERYNEERRRILTTAPRVSFAADVPRDVQPIPDAYAGDGVTIGFLLDAVEDGRIGGSDAPLGEAVENEFRVRLGLRQTIPDVPPSGCVRRDTPTDLVLEEGDTVGLTSAVEIALLDDAGEVVSSRVRYDVGNGSRLEAVLPDLRLRVWPLPRGAALVLCPEA